ncbi:MAG: hypothetical protein M0R35_07100 [Candidatus Omnitrophica bacterium]|nr:hypothetical protein [Candidatus Omnitrophota bacterium]
MANQYTKAKLISQKNKKEIFWNIINSFLAGSLVFLGSLSSGRLSWQGIVFGLIASFIVAITKFQNYWKKEESEYCKTKIFSFVN